MVSGILVLRLRCPAHLKCFFFARIMAASPGRSLGSGHHAGLTSPGAAPVGMPFYRACHRSCPRRLELGRTPAGAPVPGHFSGAAAGMTGRGFCRLAGVPAARLPRTCGRVKPLRVGCTAGPFRMEPVEELMYRTRCSGEQRRGLRKFAVMRSSWVNRKIARPRLTKWIKDPPRVVCQASADLRISLSFGFAARLLRPGVPGAAPCRARRAPGARPGWRLGAAPALRPRPKGTRHPAPGVSGASGVSSACPGYSSCICSLQDILPPAPPTPCRLTFIRRMQLLRGCLSLRPAARSCIRLLITCG